ncbi:MAG: hypothetical protein D6748_14630 [Calditrichaeota bacterium]|nr:MAG: hypothetical protein D6748_14630 [Calditrichota bacterium]
MKRDPLEKTKAEYQELIQRLSSEDSPVGIDAQYTHAVIIDYLQQIWQKLEEIERKLAEKEG